MLPGRTNAGGGTTAVTAAVFDQNFPKLTAADNARLRLLYFSCGTDDGLVKANRDMKEWLKSRNIKFVDVETPGYAHVWRYWRVSLIDFTPRLFR
jgi:enterochelin esterase family protein